MAKVSFSVFRMFRSEPEHCPNVPVALTLIRNKKCPFLLVKSAFIAKCSGCSGVFTIFRERIYFYFSKLAFSSRRPLNFCCYSPEHPEHLEQMRKIANFTSRIGHFVFRMRVKDTGTCFRCSGPLQNICKFAKLYSIHVCLVMDRFLPVHQIRSQ